MLTNPGKDLTGRELKSRETVTMHLKAQGMASMEWRPWHPYGIQRPVSS